MQKPFNINGYLNPSKSLSTSLIRNPNTTLFPAKRPQQNEEDYMRYLDNSHDDPAYEQTPLQRSRTGQSKEQLRPTQRKGTESIYSGNGEIKNQPTLRSSHQAQPLRGKDQKQYQRELEGQIQKLKQIKATLEAEVAQLQELLDETSQNLGKADIEFEKIKLKIMEHTSRTLDAAYRNYRKNMTKWSKYQQIERKGLEVILEMDQFISQQKNISDEMQRGRVNGNLQAINRENNNRIAHYGYMLTQIGKVKTQCLQKRPTLREDRIIQFEQALQLLCAF